MHPRFPSPLYSRGTNNDSNMRIPARASSSDKNHHQNMIRGSQRAPTTLSNFVMKKEKAIWDPLTTKIFCEVCAEEVHAGNRPNTHFSKIGWDNVVNKFQRRTKRKYDQKQLKNKWESLKNQYKAWNQLIGTETGLGWDHDKGTVDADDAWREEKVNPEIASFRHGGIENLTEMEIMFSKTSATGNGSFNPYIVNDTEDDECYYAINEEFNNTLVGDETHGEFENMDVGNNLTIKKEQGHGKKRKENIPVGKIGHMSHKGKKSKVSTALMMQCQLDRICNVMETTDANTKNDQSDCGISECIAVLKKIPSIEPKTELFMLGTRLFVKREYREIFIALEEDDIRVNWLEEELRREKNHISQR
ncbi:hypothetical protein RND81_12G007200 [Saponaria officinalis]|uniref:Myb/SANT-like domain-containing protein n=1 Tax=Saponaria officinalis TaxID=3572 RepID=A0AAW1H3S0_SAPOF